MRWQVEKQAKLRELVEGAAPVTKLSDLANLIASDVIAAWVKDSGNLQDCINELGTSVDIMNDHPLYRYAGIRVRVAYVLLLIKDGRVAEAEDVIEMPVKNILVKIRRAHTDPGGRIHADAAMLFGAKAQIERVKNNLRRALIFSKAGWNAAQMTTFTDLQAVLIDQYRSLLLAAGEAAIAEIAIRILQELMMRAGSDWCLNPQLWNAKERDCD